MEPDLTPNVADQLERLLASQRRTVESVAGGEPDVNREAVGHLLAYASLLRALPPATTTADGSPAAPRRASQRYMFMLELPDGRWDVAEQRLETAPRAGDEVSFDDGKLWRVRETRMVTPAPARKPPRRMFVCAAAA